MNELRPLFSLLRAGMEEIRVYGEVVIAAGNEVLYQTGESIGRYPARSLLKPFQFLAAGLPREQWWEDKGAAVYPACLGSVSATEEQVARLRTWAAPLATRVSHIKVPPGYPMDEANRARLKAEKSPTDVIYHTCFSKHLAILESCERNGWDLASYTDPKHPYHARLWQTMGDLLGEDLGEATFVGDGCTLPTPVLSMRQMALLYQRLAAADPHSDLGGIQRLMLSNGEWIGGPGRNDTKVILKNRGRALAKEGADGLIGVSVLPNAKYPLGLGIVVKVASGFMPPLVAIALGPVLESLGLQTVHEAPRGQTVQYHFSPWSRPRLNATDISPPVDEHSAVFPGDKPYRRAVSMDTLQGHHLTLSSIDTTVHIGAHTDAPNHTTPSRQGIDAVELDAYLGSCEVVTVKKARGSSLYPADLAGWRPRARRVLFKTESFPSPTHFNTDFVALSPDLVRFLATHGVCLVGTDTPSVDTCESKDLPTHHAAAQAGMALLEGITLDGIADGLYRLVALPLRLRGADASPVRAILLPLT